MFTALRGIGTARPEATASRKLIQTWHNAVDHIELLLGFSHPGQSLQQSLGIGVQRISKQGSHIAVLHHHTGVHNQHIITHFGHYAQIMGDHHDRGVQGLFQCPHQIQDLRLDRNIQGGCGFIGDQQLRVAGEGHGDHNSLAHSAAQLMGILVNPFFRRRNVDQP